MGLWRFVKRNDPQDGTTSILVEEAGADKPEKRLPYDPDGNLPPVELSDDQVRVLVARYALAPAEEQEDEETSGSVVVQQPGVGPQPEVTDPNASGAPKPTREELEAKDYEDLQDLAKDLQIQGRSGKKKEDLIDLIVKKQEGGDA